MPPEHQVDDVFVFDVKPDPGVEKALLPYGGFDFLVLNLGAYGMNRTPVGPFPSITGDSENAFLGLIPEHQDEFIAGFSYHWVKVLRFQKYYQ